jgi:hypothetical protein
MFNDFEIKFNKEDNWSLKYLHVYNGIYVADSENEYKKGNKIQLQNDSLFEIVQESSKTSGDYYVLAIKSKEHNVFVRADQKIALEYIIYNSQQKNMKDMGRPMTFVPHLINVDSVLYHTRIKNFQFQGLINLVVVALIFSHIRLMYDSFMKTGLMLSTQGFLSTFTRTSIEVTAMYAFFIIFGIFNCFFIEKLASIIKNRKITYFLNFINFTILLSVPFIQARLGYYEPIITQFCILVLTIVFLKLYSFSHFWNDVRKFIHKKKFLKDQARERRLSKARASLSGEELKKVLEADKEKKFDAIDEQDAKHESVIEKNDPLKSSMYEEIESIISNYPKNLSFFSLFEFLFMPVLCFQYKFPRTKERRFGYLLEYGLKVVICSFLQ